MSLNVLLALTASRLPPQKLGRANFCQVWTLDTRPLNKMFVRVFRSLIFLQATFHLYLNHATTLCTSSQRNGQRLNRTAHQMCLVKRKGSRNATRSARMNSADDIALSYYYADSSARRHERSGADCVRSHDTASPISSREKLIARNAQVCCKNPSPVQSTRQKA